MIDKLIAFLSRFMAQPDKALHFAGMVLVCVIVGHFGGVLPGLWFGAGISWGKERYDKAHPDKHSPEGWDAFAALLGSLAGVTVAAFMGAPLF